jgi:bifunctional non-homologous end joining protein LigD
MVAEEPRRFTATMSKAKRTGKIFIDTFRNSRGATAVAAYSTRARPGAPVSAPLAWDEVSARIRSDHYTIKNLPRRLATIGADPWEGYSRLSQTITRAMRKAVGL